MTLHAQLHEKALLSSTMLSKFMLHNATLHVCCLDYCRQNAQKLPRKLLGMPPTCFHKYRK